MADEEDDAPVTVGEEIQCLLAAGWTWDGDKLVHMSHKETWIRYKRADSQGIGARIDQFESDLKQAVQAARQRSRQANSGGECP
jgi:hypothetical protein